jgi:hypothetical protein
MLPIAVIQGYNTTVRMKPSLFFSIVLAFGVIAGGYYLSKKKAFSAPLTDIPYGKVSSLSAAEYAQSRQASPADYEALPVRGCPPKAPADLVPAVEAVVDYRNCFGTALIPKK